MVTRHVMEERIYVDINVFCSFIERICGYLIVFNCYRFYKNFHRVVLPRSWLHRVLRQFNPAVALQQEKSRFWLLLPPLRMLLEALYFRQNSGKMKTSTYIYFALTTNDDVTDHLLIGYDLKSITRTGPTPRSIYIARMYVAVLLVSHNLLNI